MQTTIQLRWLAIVQVIVILIISVSAYPDEKVISPEKAHLPHGAQNDFKNEALPPEFKAKLMSVPLASIVRTPSPLTKMPKVTSLSKLPNTTQSDEVYDISAWFKDAMPKALNETNEETRQWIYYNKTSQHLIAFADIYLRTSINSYVHSQITDGAMQLRLKVEYIETKDSVELSLAAIRNSSYTTLFKSSSVQKIGEPYRVDAATNLSITGWRSYGFTVGTGGVDVSLAANSKSWGGFNVHLSLISGQMLIHKLGVASGAQQRILLIQADVINSDGVAIIIPPEQNDIERLLDDKNKHSDPFGETKGFSSRVYDVPEDFLELMQNEDNPTNFAKLIVLPSHVLHKQADVLYDVRGQLKASGLPLADEESAFLSKKHAIIMAGLSEQHHELLSNLLVGLTPNPPQTYVFEAGIYEVDSSSKEKRNVIDLLNAKPRKIMDIGLLSISGARQKLDGEFGEIIIQSSLGDSGYRMDFSLELKLQTEELVFNKTLKSSCKLNEFNELFLQESRKSGRSIVIVVRVDEFLKHPVKSDW